MQRSFLVSETTIKTLRGHPWCYVVVMPAWNQPLFSFALIPAEFCEQYNLSVSFIIAGPCCVRGLGLSLQEVPGIVLCRDCCRAVPSQHIVPRSLCCYCFSLSNSSLLSMYQADLLSNCSNNNKSLSMSQCLLLWHLSDVSRSCYCGEKNDLRVQTWHCA